MFDGPITDKLKCNIEEGDKVFSYASSSTLHPRQRVSRSFGLA